MVCPENQRKREWWGGGGWAGIYGPCRFLADGCTKQDSRRLTKK